MGDVGGKSANLGFRILAKHALAGGNLFLQRNAKPVFLRRTDRSATEPAAAIRADVVQHLVYAIATEGALVTADARLGGLGRQVFITQLTIRLE